ncbi:hypothetical protein FHR22_001167 [Sphingopyxis panaciterrae]|nr:hypothetical protein [Sphingopyxis panaciterrae]
MRQGRLRLGPDQAIKAEVLDRRSLFMPLTPAFTG